MFEMEYDKQMDINFDVCWMEMYIKCIHLVGYGSITEKLYSGVGKKAKI